jgi:hypothetical protein
VWCDAARCGAMRPGAAGVLSRLLGAETGGRARYAAWPRSIIMEATPVQRVISLRDMRFVREWLVTRGIRLQGVAV